MTPSPWERFVFLAGFRPVPQEHYGWLEDIVSLRRVHRSGALLAMPNAVMVAMFAVVLLLLANTTAAAILACGSVLVVVAGAFVPGFPRMRARRLIAKNPGYDDAMRGPR